MGCPESKANDKLDEAEIIESLDDVANLQHVQKLNHIIKDRPKRTRSHAPRRPMTRQTKLLEDNLEPDEGLDKFFNSSPVTENAEVLPIKNKDKDNKSDTSSSGTGSARSTPESKKKAGWLKGLGGKDKEKKQTSGLFSRNKGSKTSDDKIKRISEVDENKSNNGVTNGPVDTVTKDVLHKQESLETTPTQTPTTTSPKATPSGTPIEQKKLETATSSQIPSSTQAPAQISTPVSPTSVSPATPTSGTLASPTSGIPALPDNGTPASPSSGAPHSEQKSIDDTSEETNVKTETAETKEEKKSEEPAKVHRQPIGVHKIGLGGNMLAEMKAKQEKRLTTQSKVVKMSNISKLDSHNEEKAETTAAELTDSKKSLSNDNQSLQSSTPVEELKTERDKHPDAQVNGDVKSSPELNNNVKVKTSGLDLSVMVKTGQKAPPPMKPCPPPVAPKPGNKSGDADDLSSEDNSEANEQEDSTAKLSEEVGYANFIPVSENVKENKNLFVKDSGIAPMREKKQGGSVQSVRDRIKSMELGKDEPKKDDTKKAFSLPRGITPGGPVKTERPSSMTTSTLSDLKTQLRTPLATSTPALNTFEDDKTIYENLLADLDDTEIYENLKIQKDDNDLEHESKKKDKMNNVDKSDADKVPPVGPPDEIIMV